MRWEAGEDVRHRQQMSQQGSPTCWPMRREAGEDLRHRQPIGKRYLLTNEKRGWRGFTTLSANKEALPVDQWEERLARTWGTVNQWVMRSGTRLRASHSRPVRPEVSAHFLVADMCIRTWNKAISKRFANIGESKFFVCRSYCKRKFLPANTARLLM